MAEQTPNAVVPVGPSDLVTATPQDIGISSLAAREGLERIETEVTLPADYQYAIPRRVKTPEGNWVTEMKVGISADGYDYLNRVVGASFFLPEYVHDEQGRRSPNPIHRKDYIYLRLGCIWYTPLGQLVMATEDVEVDFNLTWMDARINSQSAAVVVKDGSVEFDAFGNPKVTLSAQDELKALKTLSQLRTFGPRYAQTVARVRLLKMATGLRSLPLDSPRNFKVRVVGYRDKMGAQERIEQAGGDLAAIYGKADEVKPLTHEEMVEVSAQVDADTETVDRELIEARVTSGDAAAPGATHWSAEDMADIDANAK